jgi:hypothetical protein
MTEQSYVFFWGNNSKREALRGRRCRIIASGAKRSCLVEFEDGQKEIVSRRALRELAPLQPQLFT